eukprot:GEZU01019397.1.p1 GENE.GEZU01019397.1~~GEZU01019397.1.p1  ORF type:complete len:367 (+),score=67.17 GEZU01019397.1:472-1572(+)
MQTVHRIVADDKRAQRGESNSTCPNCKQAVAKEDLRPAHVIRGIISTLEVRCANFKEGCCDWKGRSADLMPQHLRECLRTMVRCKYADYGCNVMETNEKLEEHEKRLREYDELWRLDDAIRDRNAEDIIGFIKQSPTHEALVTKAISALNSLLADANGDVVASKEISDEIAVAGGIECVVSAMQKFPRNPRLQTQANDALAYLADKAYADNQAKIASAGGIDAIISNMRNFPDGYAELLTTAASALWNLAFENHENRTKIGSAGGIELILNSMRHFPDDATLLTQAMNALWNLANEHPQNATKINAAGGIELVTRIMQDFPEDSSLLRPAMGALSALAENNQENQNQIAAAGGIDLIINAMKGFIL